MNRVFSQQIFRYDGIQANVVAFLIPAARHVLLLVIYSRRLRVSPPSILFSRFSCLSRLLPFVTAPLRLRCLCTLFAKHHLEISIRRTCARFRVPTHVDTRGKLLRVSFKFIYARRKWFSSFVYVKSRSEIVSAIFISNRLIRYQKLRG